MPERTDRLDQWMSAKEVATFLRTQGNRTGRVYDTYGQLWADDGAKQVGLQELILEELEELNQQQRDVREAASLQSQRKRKYALWLSRYQQDDIALVKAYQNARKACVKVLGEENLGDDGKCDYLATDLGQAYLTRCRGFDSYGDMSRTLTRTTKRLKDVKSLEDIVKLKGKGKQAFRRLLLERAELPA